MIASYNPSPVTMWVFPGLPDHTAKKAYINFNPDRIADTVLAHFGMKREEVFVKCRKRPIVVCRSLIFYFMKERTNLYLSDMARYGGDKCCMDHTTVIHAIKSISDQLDVDETMRKHYADISEKLDNI